MARLNIANSYGSVDVRGKLARTYVHVPGPRLQPLCRKLGIRYADALVGFCERGRKARFGYSPTLKGVVVAARSAPKLLKAVEERVLRTQTRPKPTAGQLAERRERRHRREVAAFVAAIKEQFPGCPDEEARRIALHACKVGSRRVGRTSSLPTDEKVHRAVVAHVRHRHTDYEELLGCHDADDRDDARELVGGQIRAVLEQWETPQETR